MSISISELISTRENDICQTQGLSAFIIMYECFAIIFIFLILHKGKKRQSITLLQILALREFLEND